MKSKSWPSISPWWNKHRAWLLLVNTSHLVVEKSDDYLCHVVRICEQMEVSSVLKSEELGFARFEESIGSYDPVCSL